MNFLNTIDNILERGLTGVNNNDDDNETNHSYSTGISDRVNESATWSEDEDSDDQVQLAFATSNVIEEENDTQVAAEDDSHQSTIASSTQLSIKSKTLPATHPVRPGNIRLRFRSNSSSSDEDEDEDGDGESTIRGNKDTSPTSGSKTRKLKVHQEVEVDVTMGPLSSSFSTKESQSDQNPPGAEIEIAVTKAKSDMLYSEPKQNTTQFHNIPASLWDHEKEEKTSEPSPIHNIPPPRSNLARTATAKVDNRTIRTNETTEVKRNSLQQTLDSPSHTSLTAVPTKDLHPLLQSTHKIKQQESQIPSTDILSFTTLEGAEQKKDLLHISKQSAETVIDYQKTPILSNKQTIETDRISIQNVPEPVIADSVASQEGNLSTSSSGWSWSGSQVADDTLTDDDEADGEAQNAAENGVVQNEVCRMESAGKEVGSERKLTTDLEELQALVETVKTPAGGTIPDIFKSHNKSPPNYVEHLREMVETDGQKSSEKIDLGIQFSAREKVDIPADPQQNDEQQGKPDIIAPTDNLCMKGSRETKKDVLVQESIPASESGDSAVAFAQQSEPSVSSAHDNLRSASSDDHTSDASLDLHGITESNSIDDSVKENEANQKLYRKAKSGQRHDSTLFKVNHMFSTWKDNSADSNFETINCYGVFHIRVLRAQRLPCPVGSTVQAVVSLKPWKGRLRSEQTTTFVLDQETSSFDHGVCALWNENKDITKGTMSLVHAYASEATPFPTMEIKLILRPVTMLEFSMCSLALPCDSLMRCPGKWLRQWFLAEMQDAKTTSDSQFFGDDQNAMIEVEAVFVPDDQSFGSSFVSIGRYNDDTQAEDDINIQQSFSDEQDAALIDSKYDADKNEKLVEQEVVDAPAGKAHLLRVKKFWKPAYCAQCSTSLLGWGVTSFRCEACGLDCCGDCRLHVDFQFPCGSVKAKDVVKDAIQNKLTVSNFLEAMAPVDEEYSQKKRDMETKTLDGESSVAETRTESGTMSRGPKGRIGTLRLNVSRACVFSKPLSPVTEPGDVVNHPGALRPGDYYVRVCRSGVEGCARTRTIPSGGKLKFEEASEMRLDVLHYGVHFLIEVVDAITDKPVGTSVLTTQGLLQEQRDQMIETGEMPIFAVRRLPPVFKGRRRLLLELRTGVRSGDSSGFFVPSESDKKDTGEISGWIEINVGLEEDIKRLFGPSPYECPSPPPDSLNLSSLNLHISRISDFIEDIIGLISIYKYMVSWKDPFVTGFSFVVFLSFTVRFNAEYVGCLPFLCLVLIMLRMAFTRTSGNAKQRFVQEELEEWKAAEKEIDVKYSLHRPVGRLSVLVSEGNNIRSKELGLAGNVGCRVFWDPLRCASEKQKEKILSLDKSARAIHEIGLTESKFTINPKWENLRESDECRRLRQVLPHHGHYFETDEEASHDCGCEFPVLQPFRRADEDDQDDNPQHVNAVLEPWKSSTGAVVFQIRFRDILNMLPGSDHIVGEVVIPLSSLIEKTEIRGWYQVLDVESNALVEIRETSSVVTSSLEERAASEDVSPLNDADLPKIFLSIRWSPPEESLQTVEARETSREASVVIQEELLRWEVMGRDKDRLKELVVGGSIGAFQKVSGFAGTLQVIQNFLGNVANTLESARNLMNFSDPYKSSILLAVFGILWLILSLVPTRVILLVAGLAQYGWTAKSRIRRFMKSDNNTDDADDGESVASDLDEDEEDDEALIIWLKNAFRGLPTDEDLRKTYFWEGRRNGAKVRETYASEKRLARLKRLWRAQWHASIKIRSDDSKSKKATTCCKWDSIFAIVQGRRFLWWTNAADFDSGKPPVGRIFLAGHAGLSGLSPLEMREIDPKDVGLVVGIFGRGITEQQRITLLMPSVDLKESLENAVIEASTAKAD